MRELLTGIDPVDDADVTTPRGRSLAARARAIVLRTCGSTSRHARVSAVTIARVKICGAMARRGHPSCSSSTSGTNMYEVDGLDRVVELTSLPQSSVGAPCPLVISDEHTTIVAYYLQETDSADEPIAIVRLTRCRATMFGPPNDEAFSGHPLAARGLKPHSVCRVESSSWIRRLARMNSAHPSHSEPLFADLQHLVFAFHDSTFEAVCVDFEVTRTRGSIAGVVEQMVGQLGEQSGWRSSASQRSAHAHRRRATFDIRPLDLTLVGWLLALLSMGVGIAVAIPLGSWALAAMDRSVLRGWMSVLSILLAIPSIALSILTFWFGRRALRRAGIRVVRSESATRHRAQHLDVSTATATPQWDRESELARKLAEKHHLSVPERAELKDGKVPWSKFVAAIRDILAEGGWYPRTWRPDRPVHGLMLERRGEQLIVHECREISLHTYAEVRTVVVDSVDDAARRFVAGSFGDQIDGIAFDWHR